MKAVYLDYNATTPIDPAVSQVMLPFLYEHFGNPSSSHEYGVSTKKAVESARKSVAEILGCSVDEIVFTSGGSEANNYAIKGVAYILRHKGNHIITTQIEHPAVLEVCKYLEQDGFQVTYLPVDEYGIIDLDDLKKSITSRTVLVSIMHANNEVGTIEPIREISKITKSHGVLLHSDCAQSIGKIPVNIKDLGVDLLSIAGHKFYAPKGVGALYVRSGVRLEKFVHGADHEMDRRAGTENVLEIVGLGKACQLVSENLSKDTEHLKSLRDLLEECLKNIFPDGRINGHPKNRLPNTLSISFPNLEANTILAELKGVAASAGAACHRDRVDISHVLTAMKVPQQYAMGTIRLSVGRFSTEQEIEKASEEIKKVVNRLKDSSTVPMIQPDYEQIKLTQYTHGLGCACKLRPQLLEQVLQKIPRPSDHKILVGAETSDDAAVYQIDEDTAIVQTVDFFTPIVDDPFQFGAIAAVNSLSDVYAMGGKPLFALNVVGFPSNRLPIRVLEEILSGAQSIAEKAKIAIIGGHTVDDTEPKFGLAVTGIVHPSLIIRNNNAKPGDSLILTKPLGTGILSTALKQGLLEEYLINRLQDTMLTLNKSAAEAMQEIGVNSCTDITGFGLLGHLLEMMEGSDTTALIESDKIKFLPEVDSMVAGGVIPGGTRDNFQFTQPDVEYADTISENRKLMLNDAQTSGGLLISVNSQKAQILLEKLGAYGVKHVMEIGKVIPYSNIRIKVV
jgi:cysteine desulfurase